MTIATILGEKGRAVFSVAADQTVAEAVKMLAERRIGAVPVIDGNAVLGIFSERDVIYCLERKGQAALDLRVSEVMTAPAITVTPEDGILGALALMTRRRIRHLPVIDQGRCVGVVSIGDLVKHRIERIETEAEAMRMYIQQA